MLNSATVLELACSAAFSSDSPLSRPLRQRWAAARETLA